MKFKKNKTLIKESIDNKYKDMISDYRKFANLDESVEITKENFDDFAISGTCAKHNIMPSDLKHILLGEGITLDQAVREAEAADDVVVGKGMVYEVLDETLEEAEEKRGYGDTSDYPAVLLVGESGLGKTEMVKQWARQRGMHLVEKNLGSMTRDSFEGIFVRDPDDPLHATKIGSNEFVKSLQKPNTVLFLDEYNRSSDAVRDLMLPIILNHSVVDPQTETSVTHLDNLLFVVAAMNPSGSRFGSARELGEQEKSRFRIVSVLPDVAAELEYLQAFYQSRINHAPNEAIRKKNEGRKAIATTILTHPDFQFDTSSVGDEAEGDIAYIPLNYRSFKKALDSSNGTKEDFLKRWSQFANYKVKPTIERILRNYQDVDDKATQALKGGTESNVFAKRKSTKDKLKELIPDLNI